MLWPPASLTARECVLLLRVHPAVRRLTAADDRRRQDGLEASEGATRSGRAAVLRSWASGRRGKGHALLRVYHAVAELTITSGPAERAAAVQKKKKKRIGVRKKSSHRMEAAAPVGASSERANGVSVTTSWRGPSPREWPAEGLSSEVSTPEALVGASLAAAEAGAVM